MLRTSWLAFSNAKSLSGCRAAVSVSALDSRALAGAGEGKLFDRTGRIHHGPCSATIVPRRTRDK